MHDLYIEGMPILVYFLLVQRKMTILPRGLDIVDTFLYESFKHRTYIKY